MHLQPLEHHHLRLRVDVRALDAVGLVDFFLEEPRHVFDLLEVDAFELEYFHDLVEHCDHAVDQLETVQLLDVPRTLDLLVGGVLLEPQLEQREVEEVVGLDRVHETSFGGQERNQLVILFDHFLRALEVDFGVGLRLGRRFLPEELQQILDLLQPVVGHVVRECLDRFGHDDVVLEPPADELARLFVEEHVVRVEADDQRALDAVAGADAARFLGLVQVDAVAVHIVLLEVDHSVAFVGHDPAVVLVLVQPGLVREDAIVSNGTHIDRPRIVTRVEEEQLGRESERFVAGLHDDHREALLGDAELTAVRPVDAHFDQGLVAVEARLQFDVVLALVDDGQAHPRLDLQRHDRHDHLLLVEDQTRHRALALERHFEHRLGVALHIDEDDFVLVAGVGRLECHFELVFVERRDDSRGVEMERVRDFLGLLLLDSEPDVLVCIVAEDQLAGAQLSVGALRNNDFFEVDDIGRDLDYRHDAVGGYQFAQPLERAGLAEEERHVEFVPLGGRGAVREAEADLDLFLQVDDHDAVGLVLGDFVFFVLVEYFLVLFVASFFIGHQFDLLEVELLLARFVQTQGEIRVFSQVEIESRLNRGFIAD